MIKRLAALVLFFPAFALAQIYTVGTGGVTANTVIQLNSTSQAVAMTSGGAYAGIAQSTKSAGQIVNVLTSGVIACVFENATTPNDLVVLGTTTFQDCHDSGQTAASAISGGTRILGYVTQAVSSGQPGTVVLGAFNAYGIASSANVTWTLAPTGALGLIETCGHWSIPYTSLNAAATTQDIALFTMPAGYQMESHVRESTTFAGPTGLTAASVSLGMTANAATEYMLPFPLFQATNTQRHASGMYSAQYAAHTVYVEFSNTTAVSPINFGNGTATSFTAGQEEVYICVQQLP